jgi:hypothetical protein
MLVLHAGFRGQHLLAWGESSDRQRSRRTNRRLHPLDAGSRQLSETLAAIGMQIPGNSFVTSEISLPSVDGEPVPSSPLVAEMPDKRATGIAQWKVTTAALEPAAAADFLRFCANKELLQPGVIAGSDLTYWTLAMRFADALVARQHFILRRLKTDKSTLAICRRSWR